ncbi:MAG: hypothetical protein WC275_01895 [Bacilli bacterium]
MELTIKKGRIFKRILLLLVSLIFLAYIANAFVMVNNRSKDPITNITWRSLNNGDLKFTEELLTWYQPDKEAIYNYKYSNGYVVAKDNDLTLEFIHMSGGRLFSVNYNTFFYHEDLLR